MLKAEPLTVSEVNTYGVGHINRYTSETCGFPNGSYTYAGCITDYSQSEIKYVVDAWASDKTSDAIEYRLIKIDYKGEEVICSVGYIVIDIGIGLLVQKNKQQRLYYL